MSRSHDVLELAAALESQGRALIAHAEKLREISGAVCSANAGATGTDTWLDADQVIVRTGLSRGQVYRLARRGELGAVRCGRSLRFTVAGLAEYARNGGAR